MDGTYTLNIKEQNLNRLTFEIAWRESGIPDCIYRVIELSALRNEMAESFNILFDLNLNEAKSFKPLLEMDF